MHANSPVDFAYPWWLTYGHLTVFLPAVAGWFVARARGWNKWSRFALMALAIWSGLSFGVIRMVNLSGEAELPTEKFLASGGGRVLDIGAGTGRSSLMVLEARPKATLVASDLFAASFDQHFGRKELTPQDRLAANLKAAGVDQRATIKTADMRKLPFEAASFDAAVSAYAMDHLNREGSAQALREAARVLKPGGEFLLILVNNDRWTKFAFGPLLSHGAVRGAGWWSARAKEAGFEVVEEGTRPATMFLLLRRAEKNGAISSIPKD